MSTKIYDGHLADNLEQLLVYLDSKKELVEQAIDKMLRAQMLRWFHDPANIEKFETSTEKYWVIWRDFFTSVQKNFEDQYAKLERSGFDFRLGLAIRLFKGRAYFWPMKLTERLPRRSPLFSRRWRSGK